MGKLHRIRKRFNKIVSKQPLQEGQYALSGLTSLYIGKRYDGSLYMMACGWGNSYKNFIKKLIREYESRVAHSDEASAGR